MTADGPILHILQCTNLGGMEHAALRSMENLRAHGVRFRLATPRPFGPGAAAFRAFDPNMRDFSYRGRFGWRDFPAFRRHIRSLVEGCRGIWVTGTCAASLAAIRGLPGPKVLSHHYPHFEGPFPWLRWRAFYELTCRDLDAVTYPSAFTRDEALRIAPWLKGRAVIVRNGCEMRYRDDAERRQARAEARRRLGLPADAFIIGGAGWLIDRKRFDVFLATAQKIAAAIPAAHFVICGDGPLRSALEGQARSLGIADRVFFSGWVQDVNEYYRAWNVVLFVSDGESFGLTPVEAAACGAVIVASVRYGGLGEFLADGENGFLFRNHDAAAMADRVMLLYSSPELRTRLREAAAETIRRDYDIEKVTRFFREVFGVEGAGASAQAGDSAA
jgi:glycosyltransferase involved in cell wall biosynthesis